MELNIREEHIRDQEKVSQLIKSSFRKDDPVILVNMLRKRTDFIKELSLVAEINEVIIGYVLLSPIYMQTDRALVKTLWLEPVCVHPEFQGRGIGTAIIKKALNIGQLFDFKSIFVTGMLEYYSRFGFKLAVEFGISSSLNIPSKALLAIELKNEVLKQGKIIFPEEIFG